MSSPTPSTSIPMYSPQQFSNVVPPSDLPAFYTQGISSPYTSSQTQSQIPATQLSYPASMFSSSEMNSGNTSNTSSASVMFNQYQNIAAMSTATPPQMQTYLTYPQVQMTSVTTPISLPGMPPITVSTTIPPHLDGFQFNPIATKHNE